MLRVLIAAAATLLTIASSTAETGLGAAPRSNLHDVLDAVGAPPLNQIGPDAFRFSQEPALGGRGYVMTFAGHADGARAEIIWLDGHPRSGWRRTRRVRLELDLGEYERLASFVDEELERGEPILMSDGEGIVCTDGPGFLTERVMDGVHRWMSGFCGDAHPNNAIKGYLAGWALDRLGN